jgi:hypothetical protein
MAPVEGTAGPDADESIRAAVRLGIQTRGLAALEAAVVACGVDPYTPGGPFQLTIPFFTACTRKKLTGKRPAGQKTKADIMMQSHS